VDVGIPPGRERILIVSLHLAGVGRDVVPLQQDVIPLQIRRELVLVLQRPVLGGDIGPHGVLLVLGGRVAALAGGQLLGHELEGVFVKVGLGGDAEGLDGRGLEFEVTFVVRGQHHAQIHHRPRLPTLLGIELQLSSHGVLGLVVVPFGDDSAPRVGPADVRALGFRFGEGFRVRQRPPHSVLVRDEVATAGGFEVAVSAHDGGAEGEEGEECRRGVSGGDHGGRRRR